MEILERLFGSTAKVRLIKLFLLNPDNAFDVNDAALRAKISAGIARREINNLLKAGFIRPKSYSRDVVVQSYHRVKSLKKRSLGWTLDPKFPYLEPLNAFLSNINPFKHKDIINKISRAGKIQLLIISGIFIKDQDSRVDLLVVGDGLKNNALDQIVKNLEAEIGKEIRYASFETTEFKYRLSMFDKLIRDILDYPHEKIINKLSV